MKRSSPSTTTPALGPSDVAPSAAPFPYRDYVAAKSALEAALKQNAFYGLATGASGTGKTSLAREIAAGLDRHQNQLLYLSAPRVSLLSVVRFVAQALRVTPKRSSLETIRVIADLLQAQPTQLVVWIDEAASLPPDTLSELRSIAEFTCHTPQLFSVVLSGTPELAMLLDSPALFALKRRFTVRCTLAGLQRDELDALLVHRFGHADARRVSTAIRDELFERARGTPALVDAVVRRALDRAGKGSVTDSQLREALDASAL